MKVTRLFFTFVLACLITSGAWAEELIVAGKTLTLGKAVTLYSKDNNDIKSGSVSYDGNKTLTLNDVTIERSGNNNRGLRSSLKGLKVVVKGNNNITTTDAAGLRFDADATIEGTGELRISSKEESVYVDKNTTLTIQGSVYLYLNNFVWDYDGKYGFHANTHSNGETLIVQGDAKVFVRGCTVNAIYGFQQLIVGGNAYVELHCNYKKPTIKELGGITLKDGIRITAPDFASYNSKVLSVVEGSSTTASTRDIRFSQAVVINETNFPDENFRKQMLGSDGDGIIARPAIVSIDVTSKDISSLKGIELCTDLTSLNCESNKLTTLDLSKNTKLQYLQCGSNQLTTLDVSKNTALIELNCNHNQLTTLDVSKNTALETLDCSLNKLTSLDLSKNNKLQRLDCAANQLTTLDLSKCSDLIELICFNDQLTALKVSDWAYALTKITLWGNKIDEVAMDAFISSLPQLSGQTWGELLVFNETLFYEENVFTKPQVAAAKAKHWNVYYYSETWNKVQLYEGSEPNVIAIDETNFPDKNFREYLLKQDYGKDAKLTMTEIAGVKTLIMQDKGISSLKGIEFFTELTNLYCDNNQLTELDVKKNTKLECLSCYNNQLTTLNVWKLTQLTELYCHTNKLTSLNISLNSSDTPLLAKLRCHGNKLTKLDVTKNNQLTELYCYDNKLKTLDVSNNTALTDLRCHTNKLTALDVTKNTALTELDCYSNQLTALDVSTNTNLTRLRCDYNQLTALDVSKNTKLTSMYCYDNKIGETNMDALISSLPTVTSGHFYVLNDDETEQNFCTKPQMRDAYKKGWTVHYSYNGNWIEFDPSNQITIAYINEKNFPDINFRNFLYAQSYGKDGELTDMELPAVKVMDVSGKNIASLKGIEFFTALTRLYCGNNQLTELDLSKNTKLIGLSCYQNQIKGAKMDALISSLPKVTSGTFRVIDNTGSQDQNVCTKSQVAAAKAKGWTTFRYDSYFEDWTGYAGSGDMLKGDVNSDGKVDIVDVTSTIDYILGRSPSSFSATAADVNGDSKVDIVDVTTIIDLILGK